MTSQAGVDPITREVVQNRLISIVREMSTTSSARRLLTDYLSRSRTSAASCSGRRRTCRSRRRASLAFSVPCTRPFAGRSSAIHSMTCQAGDVFVSNDPYLSQRHPQE